MNDVQGNIGDYDYNAMLWELENMSDSDLDFLEGLRFPDLDVLNDSEIDEMMWALAPAAQPVYGQTAQVGGETPQSMEGLMWALNSELQQEGIPMEQPDAGPWQESEAREEGEEAAAEPPKKRKVGKIISSVLFYGVLLCLVGGAFLLSQGDKKPIFGYSFMNVLTGSMEPEIPTGSLVVIKKVDLNTIQIGDDITYTKDAETSVTHRVTGIYENYEGSGERGFETQGIDNERPDFEIVPAVNVAGLVVYHVPKAGQWLDWLRNNLILIFAFAGGTVLLIVLLRGAIKGGVKSDPFKVPEADAGEKKKKQRKQKRFGATTKVISIAAAISVAVVICAV